MIRIQIQCKDIQRNGTYEQLVEFHLHYKKHAFPSGSVCKPNPHIVGESSKNIKKLNDEAIMCLPKKAGTTNYQKAFIGKPSRSRTVDTKQYKIFFFQARNGTSDQRN